MKVKNNQVDSTPVEKSKKKLYKRWWFWVLTIIVIASIGSALNGGSDSQNAAPDGSEGSQTQVAGDASDDTAEPADAPKITEESKEAAKSVDAEIYALCLSAEKDYKVFSDLISSGNSTDLDLYNTAKTLKSNLQYYNYTQLSDIEGDGIDEYKDSASMYMYIMSEVADKAMDYLDDPVTSKLSKFQEATEKVSSYALDVVSQRMSFLSTAGFTTDEVTAIIAPDSDTDSTGE